MCPSSPAAPLPAHRRPASTTDPPRPVPHQTARNDGRLAAGAELEFRGRGDRDVVCHPHTGPHPPSQFVGEGVRIGPAARQIRVESDRAGGGVDSARGSDSDSCQLIDADGCGVGGVRNGSSNRIDDRRRAALGRCRPAHAAEDLALPLDYQDIDLRSAQVDPGAHRSEPKDPAAAEEREAVPGTPPSPR